MSDLTVNKYRLMGERCAASLFVLAVCTFTNSAAYANPAAAQAVVTCDNGTVSIKASSQPLADVLDGIAKKCGLRIFTAAPVGNDQRVKLDVADKPVHKVLEGLLEDIGHLVVYNESVALAGIYSPAVAPSIPDAPMTAQQSSTNMPFETAAPSPDRQPPSPVDRLQVKIDRLRARIDSGISDQQYQNNLKIKAAEFVTHDRVWLERYEKQLAQLQAHES